MVVAGKHVRREHSGEGRNRQSDQCTQHGAAPRHDRVIIAAGHDVRHDLPRRLRFSGFYGGGNTAAVVVGEKRIHGG